MRKKKILITRPDLEKIRKLLEDIEKNERCDREKRSLLFDLRFKLSCATIVSPTDIPSTFITMHSKVQYINLDNGKISTYFIVYPEEANIDLGKLSVLTPIGTALIGYSAGDIIECKVPAGLSYLKVLEVKYQPEAMGIFNS
jgi:regulator of nucleoside diphosphate kinase